MAWLHDLDALRDPHFVERGLFKPNGNEEIGTHLYPGKLWRWDGPDLRWDELPVMGGDNEAVFRGLVGLSAEDYGRLEADGNLSLDYHGPDGAPL